MKTITITTSGQNQVIDITDRLNTELPSEFSGIIVITILHTTCALTTADLDPGTDLDLLDAFKSMVPKLNYRHPHNPEAEHVGDHIMSTIIGTTLSLPVVDGNILLGTWQRVVVVELDGPRKRNLTLSLLNEYQD